MNTTAKDNTRTFVMEQHFKWHHKADKMARYGVIDSDKWPPLLVTKINDPMIVSCTSKGSSYTLPQTKSERERERAQERERERERGAYVLTTANRKCHLNNFSEKIIAINSAKKDLLI